MKHQKKRKKLAEPKPSEGFSEIGLKIRQQMIKAGLLTEPQRKAA
jgi:hypothetical protein